jgi:hypothetical protein
MAHNPQPIDFDDFARHLAQVFDQVRRRHQPILVERDGQVFRVELQEPEDIWEGYDPEKVERALRASRGLFAGTNTEQFLAEMHEQRGQGPNRLD